MSLKVFHPAVSGWLNERFGGPTPVQERAWEVTAQRGHALIAAPTGSGKTLAAFLAAIDELVHERIGAASAAVHGGAQDERDATLEAASPSAAVPREGVRVLYVSPLKALSNDVRKNLEEPLAGITARLVAMGLPDPGIRAAVRTGDTTAAERERMRRTPPHILVTTPESLFILLGSNSGRAMLGSVRSVIVDELHALAGNKRGAHLMLSLERLATLCRTPPVRIGLSATVRPLQDMASFLVGVRDESVTIIDEGHQRERDLAIELPRSPLSAVLATEVAAELHDRLAELAAAHRTTLVFVNQRRQAERFARALAERLGEEHVAAHHGSLAREHRLAAEQRLKAGELKVLVATSALELGIDIGDVDLVCQLGSPGSINAFVQRVGRSGHAVGAVPKGRLFPLTLDDLLECTALLYAVRCGELDRIVTPAQPLDVLAQQIVAEVSCSDWPLDALYAMFTRAWPYRELSLGAFEQVVQMLAEGFATRRGRRSAWLHLDGVNRMLRARRGARLMAVTHAGVIPDQFDSDVMLLPEGHRIGTLNEDFAFESLPGDIFQLGNTSYRIAKVETGKVWVEDARGQPPSMPFWFGERPGRSDELSAAVMALVDDAAQRLDRAQLTSAALAQAAREDSHPNAARADESSGAEAGAAVDEPTGAAAHGATAAALRPCIDWMQNTLGLPAAGAVQLAQYLGASMRVLGALPGARTIVLERFFDEVGDTHLVIHSPRGSRINRAWGLALRKRMCRTFNFELQASALEDSIILSLGPSHAFDLDEVARWLKPATARALLVQALLDAPMFGTRWRWAASVALAIRKMSGGRRLPPQFQRSDAEDLLSVVFPDQVACAENLVGDREVPDHPLVSQVIDDCLHDAMDIDGFLRLLTDIASGDVQVHTREPATPSPIAQAILNARPYAFLDGGEAEERRTKNVRAQSPMDLDAATDFARPDLEAIAAVREEACPEIGNAEELHDALMVHGFLRPQEVLAFAGPAVEPMLEELAAAGRVTSVEVGDAGAAAVHVAAERLHELLSVLPQAKCTPSIQSLLAPVDEDIALRELVRGRLELLGPVTTEHVIAPLPVASERVRAALLSLQVEGSVMRGAWTGPDVDEWCERRLLARIQRRTRDRQRAQYQQPVTPAVFMRFLLRWHRVAGADGDDRRASESGLLAALEQLEGFAAPAGAWEDDLLLARVRDYAPAMLDALCTSGRIVWWRPAPASGGEGAARRSGPVRGTPVMLCPRSALPYWQWSDATTPDRVAHDASGVDANVDSSLSSRAQRVLDVLREYGASFFADLQRDARLLRTETEIALAELVAQGLVTCDSFAGLRALIMPAERRNRMRRRHPGREPVDDAGRWSIVRRRRVADNDASGPTSLAAPHVEHIARVLLRRYGVVFRRVIEREDGLPPWRDLHYVYRRLEARGEIRGGRFVSGFSGEQFALAEAAMSLRALARDEGRERVCISAVDPLNMAGLLTPGERVPRLSANRLLLEGGVPIAALVGGDVMALAPLDAKALWEATVMLRRQPEAEIAVAA